jgi:hypothetical protein
MLKQVLALTAAVVLGGLITVALMDRPASAQAAGGDSGGKMHVVASGNAFIMYDSTAGSFSWVTFPAPGDKKFAWFPIKRLDTDQQVGVWRAGKTDKTD